MRCRKPVRPLAVLAGLRAAVAILDIFLGPDHDWICEAAAETMDAVDAAVTAGAWTAEAHASAALSIETVIVGQGPTGAEVEPGEAKAIARGLATLAGVIVRVAS